jgi:uncharacterized coiled-coil DUF342 family protein
MSFINRKKKGPMEMIEKVSNEWMEFELWAWLKLCHMTNLTIERRNELYKIALKTHEERGEKLEALKAERDKTTGEMIARDATNQEIQAYHDSVYPEISMYLRAWRSLD